MPSVRALARQTYNVFCFRSETYHVLLNVLIVDTQTFPKLAFIIDWAFSDPNEKVLHSFWAFSIKIRCSHTVLDVTELGPRQVVDQKKKRPRQVDVTNKLAPDKKKERKKQVGLFLKISWSD